MKKGIDLGWSDLKKNLQNADKGELINLIRDLYSLSEENRRYILAGRMDTKVEPEILEAYKEIIKNEFFPEKRLGTLRYALAEKAINSYF